MHRAETNKKEEKETENIIDVTDEQSFEQKLVTVVRTVAIRLLSKTFVLGTTKAKGIVWVDISKLVEQEYASIATCGVMDE